MLAVVVFLLLASTAHSNENNAICKDNTLNYYAYKVPKHACACNAKTAGTLRYHNNQIQFCNGKEYMTIGQQAARAGSIEKPAQSCHDILAEDRY